MATMGYAQYNQKPCSWNAEEIITTTQIHPQKHPCGRSQGGGYFSCGLTYPAHNPVCWGAKDLDNSTRDAIAIPSAYQGIRYSSISSGGWHTCAIRDDGSGTVDCWGVLTSPAVAMRAVSAGADVMYGLKLDNTSYTWGINWKSRARIWKNDPLSHYSAIYSGWYHVCGIELITNATLCWGINEDSQCNAPTNYTFSSLTLGKNHTCGLRLDNHTVVCWGDNTYGQCDAPIGVPFSLISAADWFTCGVRRDLPNQVLCWGTVQGNVNQLVSSEGTCLGFCQSDQYYIGGKCPTATDIICLDCSTCSSGMVLSSPCGSTNDTVCVPQPSPSPPPQPRPTPPPSSSSSSSSSISLYIIVGASVGGLLVLVALVGTIFFVIRRRRANPSTQEPSDLASSLSSQGIQEFNSSSIQEATSSYSENAVLGRGASCRVYKGVFKNGEEVAVKKPIDTPNDRLFEQELQLLRRLNHICLVNLVGYCRHEKILIFELMANGSLYDCLFQKKSPELDWRTRIKVAAQAARGLVYLHNDVRPSIIHRDVKSANVLLDKNWNAHVSDFGISLFGPNVGDTHIIGTSIVGTPGYLDPEYTQTLILTSKSDVYSFGVVLLELLFGRPACMKEQEFIVDWASTVLQSGNIRLDPSLAVSIDASILHELLQLAMECIRRKRQDRPDMVHVSRKLEGFLERAKIIK